MIHSSLRRYWIGHIRLALTLFGLSRQICTLGIRPSAASCALNNHFRDYQFSSTLRYHYYSTGEPVMTSSGVLHVKSRCPQYPGSQVKRCPVPDDKVEWSQNWPEYSPVSHTDPAVTKKPKWADPEIGKFSVKFNALDGEVDRTSFEGNYRVENGKPLNPRGRTGVTGRGLLGRWGPNHAADPIVTRWKMDKKGAKMPHAVSKRPILQFVSIKRKDCGEWAIPGGMVDPGEQISLTLQREFSEEALNSLAMSASDKTKLHARITNLFKSPGIEVYKGYVDDPRNTDNAWMETVAVNFHDESGDSVSELPLQAGDDAGQVQWVDVDSSFPLYASHSSFLERVAKERSAHW
ncbi:ADP-ribose pyrophosphatase, mitochondrial [Periophthalmus magnuspinnatus]|uniref:ADP-ribose pyrophosphatase, mitochondrial n=1 Tax=Periophthalmus magnuspinnatus TaxID=409849 RepID=UPI00145AD1CE|nr:ADP-ribose pyrophosphatase, mitochondrial [Periophthalmus magnuspinnatus]